MNQKDISNKDADSTEALEFHLTELEIAYSFITPLLISLHWRHVTRYPLSQLHRADLSDIVRLLTSSGPGAA